jgi:hypothetical protein
MYRLLGRIFALTVLLSVLSGCGTLFGRGGEYYAPDYYKGTSYDLESEGLSVRYAGCHSAQ